MAGYCEDLIDMKTADDMEDQTLLSISILNQTVIGTLKYGNSYVASLSKNFTV